MDKLDREKLLELSIDRAASARRRLKRTANAAKFALGSSRLTTEMHDLISFLDLTIRQLERQR